MMNMRDQAMASLRRADPMRNHLHGTVNHMLDGTKKNHTNVCENDAFDSTQKNNFGLLYLGPIVA
jgi:hypothetical protein